jgi:hypothetical protein
MKKNLTRIAPLRAGLVLGILYGIFSLLLVPFFLLAGSYAQLAGPIPHGPNPFLRSGFVIVLPIIYAFMGFIGGIIMAALYNLIARWTSGFEFEVRDVPPTL